MGAWDWLTGTDDTVEDYENLSDDQLELRKRITDKLGPLNDESMNYIMSILSDDPEAFAAFEAPYQQQFQEETIPNILERFSSKGARSSSALNQSLGKAGKDLSMGLASQRAQLKDSALGRLQGFNNQSLNPSKTPYTKSGKGGLLDQLAPLAGPAMTAFGGPLAGSAMSFINNIFGKGGASSGTTGGGYDQEFRMDPSRMGY